MPGTNPTFGVALPVRSHISRTLRNLCALCVTKLSEIPGFQQRKGRQEDAKDANTGQYFVSPSIRPGALLSNSKKGFGAAWVNSLYSFTRC